MPFDAEAMDDAMDTAGPADTVFECRVQSPLVPELRKVS
jgi:hypothetical protein